jgi:hypothetical protein
MNGLEPGQRGLDRSAWCRSIARCIRQGAIKIRGCGGRWGGNESHFSLSVGIDGERVA